MPPEYNSCIASIAKKYGDEFEIMSNVIVGDHRTMKIKTDDKVIELDLRFNADNEIIPAVVRSVRVYD